MTRKLTTTFLFMLLGLSAPAQTTTAAPSQDQAQAQQQSADPTQSFVSPLGLGTGATLGVTAKGTSVTASIEQQLARPPINFWQVGFSGTLDKNGQTQVFSSQDKDAPGFKGKVGFGYSSFIKVRPVLNSTAADFLRQAWCRDALALINKTLEAPADIPADAGCSTAVSLVQAAMDNMPPGDADTRKTDYLVLTSVAGIAATLTENDQTTVCKAFKIPAPNVYQLCPEGAKARVGIADQQRKYPELYSLIVRGAPGKFQWKGWASWAPNLTSVNYRTVNNGVPDLANKLQWTRLLNTGVGDLAFYYGPFALGVEGGFGQTVQVSTQNVCNNITSGTFTSQKCDTAMIGQPKPSNSWLSSETLEVYPLPGWSKNLLIRPGAQVVFSYVAPTAGGHSSEITLPFYFAPSASPMKFVFGIQPTWDWNTDPKIGKKFSVSVFAGARPSITK
jgi:hypothetical protein